MNPLLKSEGGILFTYNLYHVTHALNSVYFIAGNNIQGDHYVYYIPVFCNLGNRMQNKFHMV